MLYPFGFGRTYCQFGYDDFELSSAALKMGSVQQVNVRITNQGVSTRTINAKTVFVIHTTDDQKYLKRRITKLEKWLGYTGVNVGSLSSYKVYPDEIRDIILSGVKN